jgi:hypothetical protein
MSNTFEIIGNGNKPELTTEKLFEIVKHLSVLDSDNEINLTPIAKVARKRIDTWKKTNAEILDEIRITLETETELLRVKKGFDGEQGTYTNNPDVFLEFLRYCSPKIAVKMTKIVSELFSKGTVELLPQKPLTLLELLDLTRNSELARIKAEEQLTKANIELNHKQEIILDLTADIPPKEMRKTINEVIRWKRGDYGARWNKLYKQFKYHFSVDIPTRAKHRDMAKLDYAQKENLLTKLYKLSLELFEKDNPEPNQLQLI